MENEKKISINDIVIGGTYKFKVSGRYYGNDDRMKALEGKWFVGLLTDKRTDGITDDFVVFDIIKPQFKLGDDTDVYIGLNFWDKLEIMTYNPSPDKLEVQGRNVITVCGSIRFAKLMNEISQNLIKSGHVVMCPNCYATPANNEWINKINLVNLHKQMIDSSDELYVVNPGGYIGETTSELILYAEEHGKMIMYYEPIQPKVKVTVTDESTIPNVLNITTMDVFDTNFFIVGAAYRIQRVKDCERIGLLNDYNYETVSFLTADGDTVTVTVDEYKSGKVIIDRMLFPREMED